MESWKPKHKKSAKSKAKANCKKHPKHRQSPGVCSICLSEKLTQVQSTNSSASRSKFSSSSSSYLSSLSSSSNISSYSSPVHDRSSFHVTFPWKSTGKSMLKKSRSMAFVLQRRKEDDNAIGKSTKSGFWSKLLHPRNMGLMKSRTTRERVSNTEAN